jgi:hypothetical protein
MPKTSKVADPAQIDWAARSAKRRNDHFIDMCLSPLLSTPSDKFDVLSLPGGKWLWEQHLAQWWGKKFFHFQGVERFPALRRQAAGFADTLNELPGTNAYHEILEETLWKAALKNTEKQFDIIYADYMGAWGVDKLNDVEIIADRALLKPFGCLVITLSLARNASPLFSEIQAYARGDFECMVVDDRAHLRTLGLMQPSSVTDMSTGIPRMVVETAAERGLRLEPVMAHIYYNTYETAGADRLAPEISLSFRHAVPRWKRKK